MIQSSISQLNLIYFIITSVLQLGIIIVTTKTKSILSTSQSNIIIATRWDNKPGGEVDAVAVSPVRRTAAGDVEHARDAPGLVVVV